MGGRACPTMTKEGAQPERAAKTVKAAKVGSFSIVDIPVVDTLFEQFAGQSCVRRISDTRGAYAAPGVRADATAHGRATPWRIADSGIVRRPVSAEGSAANGSG